MLQTFQIWRHQGKQYIPDVTSVELPKEFRGAPIILNRPDLEEARACAAICPTGAISTEPFSLDMGKCVFCGACENAFPNLIRFTNNYKTASNDRKLLLVTSDRNEETRIDPNKTRREITQFFGGSLKLRQVSAAGCNGCELELNACSNVNFDMARFGVEFVASPRHADGVVISGPIGMNMAQALQLTYDAIPNPKLVALFGACAISGGIFQLSEALDRKFLEKYPVDLFVPGCPPHPLTFVNGILQLIRHASIR